MGWMNEIFKVAKAVEKMSQPDHKPHSGQTHQPTLEMNIPPGFQPYYLCKLDWIMTKMQLKLTPNPESCDVIFFPDSDGVSIICRLTYKDPDSKDVMEPETSDSFKKEIVELTKKLVLVHLKEFETAPGYEWLRIRFEDDTFYMEP